MLERGKNERGVIEIVSMEELVPQVSSPVPL